MDKTVGAALLLIGAVALFAAIVGGGVKIREIEVGSLPSRWRQGFLALFGLVIGLIGLVMVMPDNDTTSNNTAETENSVSDDENAVDVNAVDANAPETNAADENAVEPAADENAATGENATQ